MRQLAFFAAFLLAVQASAATDPLAPDDDLSALLDDESIPESNDEATDSVSEDEAADAAEESEKQDKGIFEVEFNDMRLGFSPGSLYGFTYNAAVGKNRFKQMIGWYPGGLGGYSTWIFDDGKLDDKPTIRFGVGANYAQLVDALGNEFEIWAYRFADDYSESNFSVAVHGNVGLDFPINSRITLTADIYPGIIVFPMVAVQWPVQLGVDMRFF